MMSHKTSAQYYGTVGLGDASFVEDDNDYEFLLDEALALARDGLYRGMSPVILSLIILFTLISTRQLQESVVFVR